MLFTAENIFKNVEFALRAQHILLWRVIENIEIHYFDWNPQWSLWVHDEPKITCCNTDSKFEKESKLEAKGLKRNRIRYRAFIKVLFFLNE